ncbi:hypothetical protein HBH79_212770 [Parastagonospora nodorum]|nr:hypothetical protein HBH83_208930 [Parastagonospora nodorum]KAH4656076.1 hypothetical protein HBH79_212770 [Parastagonospora nodorum]
MKQAVSSTYDHRALNTRLPVRSAIFKQRTGGLVVRWVTTGESPLLYVFVIFCIFCSSLLTLLSLVLRTRTSLKSIISHCFVMLVTTSAKPSSHSSSS